MVWWFYYRWWERREDRKQTAARSRHPVKRRARVGGA
jgi:hypothetical protein